MDQVKKDGGVNGHHHDRKQQQQHNEEIEAFNKQQKMLENELMRVRGQLEISHKVNNKKIREFNLLFYGSMRSVCKSTHWKYLKNCIIIAEFSKETL